MKKDRITKIATVAVLAVLAAIALTRNRQTVAPPGPQDTIYEMLDAARSGDTQRYLAQFAGRMQVNLKQTVAERSDADFRNYLKATNAEIKGVALSPPKQVSDTVVELRVEYVYQDRNEVQTVLLEKQGDRWKIARVDGAERIKTLIPYGTPVP